MTVALLALHALGLSLICHFFTNYAISYAHFPYFKFIIRQVD